MKALTLTPKEHSVAVQDIPTPEPGPREILVRVRAVALNHVDALYTYKPIAAQEYRVIGSDFAGEVASVGKDIRDIDDPRVKVGARVAGFVQGACSVNYRPGAFAEYVVIDYDLTWNIPIGVLFQEAATISLCGLTAAQGVFSRLELPGPFTQSRNFDHLRLANEGPVNVFIYGATTSLGLFAAQLVRLAEKTSGTRIRLIGAASSAKHDMLRQAPYSYDELVDYRDADWQVTVRKVCGISGGVHYGIDAVSQSPSVERVHDTLVNEGKLAVFRAPALAGFDPSKLRIRPITGAVWEGLGVEIQYQGVTFPANLEAREFATQFYNYLGSEASLGKVKLQANPVRLMPGGLESIASEGIPLFGPNQVNEPPKDHMRPVSGEKVVYTVS
ncbi:GroES-like protein [Colletotrichum scovillei]|uniref:GroES-like protein n=1 Tax=Colletotrichum scovillei TaxID=1209932 RepID=A0A9P7QXV2_9PEZI|nr:GroES-like protein [Colletotrichum scovillei]KAG7052314.1 GroES-like protein [Colletotrichum scovillei]KAG7064606.1 GroES-like protein [Colletotrichum scovillei]